MLPLIKDLQVLAEEREIQTSAMIVESADKFLGQIYAKLNNRHRTIKQQDIDVSELAKSLAGFRVLGKSDLRGSFSDIAKPKQLLRLLNDIAEAGQEKAYGEDEHRMVIADDRLKEIGEAAPSFIEQYEQLLKNLEEDNEDDQSRETLLRDINKMRTFFEQIRGKLKAHLSSTTSTSINPAQPATA